MGKLKDTTKPEKSKKGIKKHKNVEEKAIYTPGTILVTFTTDGRHDSYSFYEVTRLTKSKAPKVKSLKTQNKEEYNSPHGGSNITTPILGEYSYNSLEECMRWYKNAECYLTQDDGKFMKSARMYASTEVYNPSKIYKNTWITD